GIGPAYEDRVARRGIRIGDLFNRQLLEQKLQENLAYHNFILENFHKADTFSFEKMRDDLLRIAEKLEPFVTDVSLFLDQRLKQGANLLFEGAQGTLLDVDHGTYPFVTSSSTVAGSACTGSGIGPTKVDYVLGIVKAYTTRVGSGPFPTELNDDIGKTLAKVGAEFGATTGRARRCGWFDAIIVQHAIRANGLTGLALTKLDVLDHLDTIKICTGYTRNGQVLTTFPDDPTLLEICQPIYEEMPGWKTSTIGTKDFNSLPQAAKDYIKRLETLLEVPVDILSTGPDREETLIINNPFQK
ncbi:adenylosuccinate synthase, partial [Magnetococcales bacterium HHB-1]